MKKIITAIIICYLYFGASIGHAALVTVGGTTYDVATLSGSFSDNSAQLQSQVWWGDDVLAEEFAIELGDALGTTTYQSGPLLFIFGPLFAYATDGSEETDIFGWDDLANQVTGLSVGGYEDRVITFAIASQVPLPAAAWLFGSALLGLAAVKRKKA